MLVIYNEEEDTFEMRIDFITVTCKLIIKNVYNYDDSYFALTFRHSNEFFQYKIGETQEIVLIEETLDKKQSKIKIEKQINEIEDKFKLLINNKNNTTNSLLIKSKYTNQFYSLVDIWDKIEKYLMEINYL